LPGNKFLTAIPGHLMVRIGRKTLERINGTLFLAQVPDLLDLGAVFLKTIAPGTVGWGLPRIGLSLHSLARCP
jgi:hypothetical protein